MSASESFTLAAVQAAPLYFDRDASCEKACRLIQEAADKGANLAAFSECWLPGHPFFGSAGSPFLNSIYAEVREAYLDASVEIPSPTTERLCQAAADCGIDVAIGIAERDTRTQGTTYCTLLFIGSDGRILGRHRKLKPFGPERTVWGEGDGSGLRTYQRPYGRIGGLNCGEHYMMLPGYALVAQGIQIHVSTWPLSRALGSKGTNFLVARAFAAQASCYAIAVGGIMIPENVPEQFRDLDVAFRTKSAAGSCIVDPSAQVLVVAPAEEEAIITAQGSLETIRKRKTSFDIAGHYARPDVFKLVVNRQQKIAVEFNDPGDGDAGRS